MDQTVEATGCIHHDDMIPFAILNTGDKETGWQERDNDLKEQS